MSSHQEKHIALFGGAFDPPHYGHALAIRQILDTRQFDEVWVTPTSVRPDKHSLASGNDRKKMVASMISEVFHREPVVLASHVLDSNGSIPTTIDEIRYLAREYPKHRFSIAIGRDQADALQTWNDFEELRKRATFLILARDGVPARIPNGIRATVLDPNSVAWMNLSSTNIRNRVREGYFIEGTTPSTVERYITEKQLYRKE